MQQVKTIGLGLFTVQHYSGQIASVTISLVHFWFGDACFLEATRSSSCVDTGNRSRACDWFSKLEVCSSGVKVVEWSFQEDCP